MGRAFRAISAGRVALAQHRHVQPPLERQQLLDPEPAQEAEIDRAATEGDVLTVVELEAVSLERERRPA